MAPGKETECTCQVERQTPNPQGRVKGKQCQTRKEAGSWERGSEQEKGSQEKTPGCTEDPESGGKGGVRGAHGQTYGGLSGEC